MVSLSSIKVDPYCSLRAILDNYAPLILVTVQNQCLVDFSDARDEILQPSFGIQLWEDILHVGDVF